MTFRKSLYLLLAVAIIGILPYAVNAATLQLTLVGVRPDGANDGQWYIDPYKGVINNNGPAVDIWCVDYAHESYLNTTWTVNVTSASGTDFLSTYLHDQEKYLEILWLIGHYNASPGGYTMEEVQWAIWSYSGDSHPTDAALRGMAAAGVGNVNPAGWNILTDVNKVSQEFVVDPTVVIPGLPNPQPFFLTSEPGFLLLLGLGIGVVSVIIWLAGGPKR